MRISIIGAGVVGVTTAYMLAKLGHEVSVFDREPGAAMESSFANGGQLSYGFASPMGTPSLLGKVPAIMVGADPAFKLPSVISADFVTWALQFLRHCLPARSRRDAAALAELAGRSGEVFKTILDEVELSFGHRKAGKLVLLKSPSDFEKARKSASASGQSARKMVLSWRECLALEPALEKYIGQPSGGIWVEADEVGDAAQFSEQLVSHCQENFGAKFFFNSDVARIVHDKDGVREVILSDDERHASDAVVVSTGVAGKKLLQQLGVGLPICPVMGYSLTAPAGPHAPEIAVTDAAYKIVFSRIDQQVRIAGFADFGIASEERRRQRVQDLIRVARKLIPEVADYSQIRSTWIGARPATPGSLPIVGGTKIPGLYMNMGHGMFGWTLSAVTAQELAKLIGPASLVSRAA